jgi:hypothetical protein
MKYYETASIMQYTWILMLRKYIKNENIQNYYLCCCPTSQGSWVRSPLSRPVLCIGMWPSGDWKVTFHEAWLEDGRMIMLLVMKIIHWVSIMILIAVKRKCYNRLIDTTWTGIAISTIAISTSERNNCRLFLVILFDLLCERQEADKILKFSTHALWIF